MIIEVFMMGIFNFLKKEKEVILENEFPIFNGRKTWSESKKTKTYVRKDYYYKYNPEKLSSYIPLVNSCGFSQKNDKRYEKNNGNCYIIIEKLNNRLHIAFHVKK